MNKWMLSFFSLFRRESLRFLRQKSRIAGALGTPLVFWFLMGSGLNNSFKGDVNYLQYFYPGTILLILLFTAIFSTISIIEDRSEGFLQSVLVSPAPRSALVFGKLMGGTLIALIQGVLFLLISPLFGLSLTVGTFFFLLLVMAVISFGLTSMGFVLAWKLDSTQGFHAIMNLFLMPLWLLSGALFPIDSVPVWLGRIMIANPLTYAISALQKGFFGTSFESYAFLNSRELCLAVLILFGIVMFLFSTKVVTKNK